MSPDASAVVVNSWLVFCRIGACLMLMPIFASPQVPAQIRLFIALAVSLSIVSLAGSGLPNPAGTPVALSALIVAELTVGIVMGAVCRFLVAAVQFAGGIIGPSAGFAGLGLIQDGTGEMQPELGALLTISVVALMLTLDFHLVVIRAAVESYAVLPIGAGLSPDAAMAKLVSAASASAIIAIQLAGPFIIGGILLNFAFGVVNKIAPQIPVIFISAPFLMAAALWLLLHIAGDLAAGVSRSILSITEAGLTR